MLTEFRFGDKGIYFLDRMTGATVSVLSVQQIKVMDYVSKSGIVFKKQLRLSVYGDVAKLTPSQRASLSRSIRRLESLGLIKKVNNCISITEAGSEFADSTLRQFREVEKRFAEKYGRKS